MKIYYILVLSCVLIVLNGCITTNSTDSGVLLLLSNRLDKLENNKNQVDLKPIYDEIQKIKDVIKRIEKNKVQAIKQKNKNNINIIWIKMKNKSMMPIEIEHIGNHWIGPKGEFYDHLPTEKELKLLYRQ